LGKVNDPGTKYHASSYSSTALRNNYAELVF